MPTVRAGELNMYYELAGPARAEPVVFISGLGADHTVWSGQVQEFQDRYLCLTFDNRDAGRTEQSPRNEYTITEMAQDVVELTYALGIDYAHIVGHSMGGAIAQEIAIGFPERIASLTLVSTFSRLEPLGLMILKDIGPINTLAENGFLSELVAPFAFNMKAFNDQLLIGFLREHGRPSPFSIPTDAYKRQLRAIMKQDTTAPRLGLIGANTLAVVGESDLVTSAAGMQRIAQAIPKTYYYSFPNTGHAPFVEHPYEFNQLLLGHLAANPLRR